jgi:hypothetical protein
LLLISRDISDFGDRLICPKLGERFKEAFLSRLVPTQHIVWQFWSQHYPQIALQHQKGGVPVITLANDQVALSVFNKARVVPQNAFERRMRGKAVSFNRSNIGTLQKHFDIIVTHVQSEWGRPTLWPLHRGYPTNINQTSSPKRRAKGPNRTRKPGGNLLAFSLTYIS